MLKNAVFEHELGNVGAIG